MLLYVVVCSCMFLYVVVTVCYSMLLYVILCYCMLLMLLYVTLCYSMLLYVTVCYFMLLYVTLCYCTNLCKYHLAKQLSIHTWPWCVPPGRSWSKPSHMRIFKGLSADHSWDHDSRIRILRTANICIYIYSPKINKTIARGCLCVRTRDIHLSSVCTVWCTAVPAYYSMISSPEY